MKHASAIIMKYIAIALVLWIVMDLVFNSLSIGNVLWISAVITIISYAGDLYIMPKVSNVMACVTDVIMVFVLLWLLAGAATSENFLLGAAISAVVIGIVEYPYHISLLKKGLTAGGPSTEARSRA